MRKTIFLLFFIVSLIISGCSNSVDESVQQTLLAMDTPTSQIIEKTIEVTAEVTVPVTVEVTKIIEIPVTVTFTPGPSPTPTNTSTPTPSPTPFGIGGCIGLQTPANYANIKTSEYDETVYPFYDKYDGKCVKFFYSRALGIVGTDYGWISELFDISFYTDDQSPSDYRNGPSNYSTVWGIWTVDTPGDYSVLLRRVDEFPKNQQPIMNDGFYTIGKDFTKSAGQWKSIWPPGTVDNCYWARTNPDTGDIKANHFGLAGIYTRLYEGDMFESDDCAPWIFVGQ